MEEKYLQNLADSAKKELRNYSLYAQEFGLINTLFIKKILDKDNAHLFIQLAETKKLYLPIIKAIFIFLYEKNYCESVEKEFNLGDIIFNKNDNRSYKIEAININLPSCADKGYKLTRKHILYNQHGINNEISEDVIYIPDNKFQPENYIKVTRDTTRREDFKELISFLNEHLKIEDVISNFTYKIAIVCCKKELIDDLGIGVTKKTIPYHYLTRDGRADENLPIEPLIYIASDYQTIREHVFDKGEKLEAVIFFDKYNNFETISKDIRQGQLKKTIFIGQDNLEFKHENLLKWRWSAEEFCHFHSQDFSPARITPIYVKNPQLLDAIDKFTADIEEIEKYHSVDFYSLKYYARKALFTVVTNHNLDYLQNNFFVECEDLLFSELPVVGLEKQEIDIYIGTFQDNYKEIVTQIQFLNNAKAQRIESLNFDYLVVSAEYKDIWLQETTKNILTYSEWKRNKDKNKKVLFLGVYGYSHYQTMKNSFDDISILIYADSQEQKAFEYYENKYNSEIEDECHSNDRKNLSGLSYPTPKTVKSIGSASFDNNEQNDDILEENQKLQRIEISLKYIFNDGTFEILPIGRSVLIQQHDDYISVKLKNVKTGDVIGVYHNVNKSKLEEIANIHQKKIISDTRKYANIWKCALIRFYNQFYSGNEIGLLNALHEKGADISNIATLNRWLNMKDKILFPAKPKNLIAIKELVNDDSLNSDLKLIAKQRELYRGVMHALGRDFSNAISNWKINNEESSFFENKEQIEKIFKENIKFKKLIKITEPNAKEQFEQDSLIFQDNSQLVNNENNQIEQEEDTVTNEEFEALVKESENLAKEAKEQADNLDESIEELESDIKNKLDTVINENAQLKEQIEELRKKLQQAENKIDSLGTMQIKHHEAIRQLIKSFTGLNTKVENLKSALK